MQRRTFLKKAAQFGLATATASCGPVLNKEENHIPKIPEPSAPKKQIPEEFPQISPRSFEINETTIELADEIKPFDNASKRDLAALLKSPRYDPDTGQYFLSKFYDCDAGEVIDGVRAHSCFIKVTGPQRALLRNLDENKSMIPERIPQAFINAWGYMSKAIGEEVKPELFVTLLDELEGDFAGQYFAYPNVSFRDIALERNPLDGVFGTGDHEIGHEIAEPPCDLQGIVKECGKHMNNSLTRLHKGLKLYEADPITGLFYVKDWFYSLGHDPFNDPDIDLENNTASRDYDLGDLSAHRQFVLNNGSFEDANEAIFNLGYQVVYEDTNEHLTKSDGSVDEGKVRQLWSESIDAFVSNIQGANPSATAREQRVIAEFLRRGPSVKPEYWMNEQGKLRKFFIAKPELVDTLNELRNLGRFNRANIAYRKSAKQLADGYTMRG